MKILVLLFCTSTLGFAQKIKLVEGKVQSLHNEVAVNFEFMYDTLHGDDDHNNSFEARFLLGFTRQSKLKINDNAPYTLLLHSFPSEPHKDDTVYVVETQHKSKRIARIAVPKSQDKLGKELGKFIRKQSR